MTEPIDTTVLDRLLAELRHLDGEFVRILDRRIALRKAIAEQDEIHARAWAVGSLPVFDEYDIPED